MNEMKIKFFLAKSSLGERKGIRVNSNIVERDILESLDLFSKNSRVVTRKYAKTKAFLSAKLLTGRSQRYYVNNSSF